MLKLSLFCFLKNINRGFKMATEAQIRKRKSYIMFKKIAQMIKQGKQEEILKFVHKSIDERNGYGSETNSVYAEQSMNLVIEEEFN